MVYLYHDHTDDEPVVSCERDGEREMVCPVCGSMDIFLGEFRTRDELAEFLDDRRGFLYTEKMIDRTLLMADLLEAWEV